MRDVKQRNDFEDTNLTSILRGFSFFSKGNITIYRKLAFFVWHVAVSDMLKQPSWTLDLSVGCCC